MLIADPLKTLDKLWDKIEQANISKSLKGFLLTLTTVAVIIYCFGWLVILKQLTDLASSIFNLQ